MRARAFWVVGPGVGEIRDETLTPPGDGDVVVRALYSGVSRGTEALVFQGRVPPTERERMRAPFQSGDFPGPVKYGYASVGRVEQGPHELRDRYVFVLFPHQTRYVAPAGSVHVLPDDVPAARAVLAANLETAINGLWDGQPQVGDRIAVVGAGTVGCLVAWLARGLPGARVELIDINRHRSDTARTLGVHFATAETATPDADLVFHASGSPAGLDVALRLAGVDSVIVEMSWYGSTTVPVALGEAFHARRLTLRSSQVGRIPPTQRSRWDTRRRMQLALDLLRDDRLDVLISGESAFDELPALMDQLSRAPGDTLMHRIRYG